MQDLGYTLGQDSSNQRHQATEEESQTFSQWFGNRRPRACTDVKRGLLAWCLTSDFPHFVFGLIQLACGQFGSIIPVLMGSFSWFCGFGNWVYPPLSCSTWPNCQVGACVLVVQCSLYHFRVVLHTFEHNSWPQSSLRSCPEPLFSFTISFPLSHSLFPHLCWLQLGEGCLCAGACAYIHLGVVQWCPRDLFPHCSPSLWFLLPFLPLAIATLFSWPPSNYLAHPLASLLVPFPFSSSPHQGTLSSLHSFCFLCMFMIVYELNPKLGIQLSISSSYHLDVLLFLLIE